MQVILDSYNTCPALRVPTDHQRAHPYRDSKRRKKLHIP